MKTPDLTHDTLTHVYQKLNRCEGMKFWRLDRKSRKGGSCILFYSEHLRALHRKDLFVDGLEGIWLQVRFPSCSVLFSLMYRPPNDRKFFDLIMSPLEKAWLKTSNIILLGDLNCDLKSTSTTTHIDNVGFVTGVLLHPAAQRLRRRG